MAASPGGQEDARRRAMTPAAAPPRRTWADRCGCLRPPSRPRVPVPGSPPASGSCPVCSPAGGAPRIRANPGDTRRGSATRAPGRPTRSAARWPAAAAVLAARGGVSHAHTGGDRGVQDGGRIGRHAAVGTQQRAAQVRHQEFANQPCVPLARVAAVRQVPGKRVGGAAPRGTGTTRRTVPCCHACALRAAPPRGARAQRGAAAGALSEAAPSDPPGSFGVSAAYPSVGPGRGGCPSGRTTVCTRPMVPRRGSGGTGHEALSASGNRPASSTGMGANPAAKAGEPGRGR